MVLRSSTSYTFFLVNIISFALGFFELLRMDLAPTPYRDDNSWTHFRSLADSLFNQRNEHKDYKTKYQGVT